MREPPSHEPNSQQSQPEPNVQQKNAGSMGGGQQATIGDGNVQVQGKGNWVWNFFFGWGGKSLTPRQEYRNRQALLTKVNNFWVKDVLEKSLYNQVMIELGLEKRPDAITNPWSPIIETDDSPQPLPDGTKIIDIFDQIGIGRTLLILGEPGSGKTTTLLELTRDLIARAEQDINQLIPVVFNLSSWANKREKIADWLVEELNSKYDVPKKIGQAWVTQQQLLLLLDGLDEVKAEYRDNCIAVLNQFKQNYNSELVVCSRIKDYESISQRLNFQSAIYLKSLTVEQIYHYLDNVGDKLIKLKALMAEDTVLQKLAYSPLMLYIMTLAYQGVAVDDLPKTEVLEERRHKLFNDYIYKMFHRHNRSKVEQKYSEEQARNWLVWLAKKMKQESQTIFQIEGLQPVFLNYREKTQYSRIVWFMTTVIIGSMIVVSSIYFYDKVNFNLIFNGLVIIICWGAMGAKKSINWIEKLIFSWSGFLSNLWFGIRHTTIPFIQGTVILHIMVFFGFLTLPLPEIKNTIAIALISSFVVSFILGIVGGIKESEVSIADEKKINQGRWLSAKNAIWGGVFGTIIMVTLSGLAQVEIVLISSGDIDTFIPKISELIMIGAIGFIMGCGMLGANACFQHLALRLILYLNHHIPWNYARFLDYAAERIFLQKVGGGYIFIHRMLMEHFAQMEIDEH